MFIDLNMATARKLSSPFASTFSLVWEHVQRSQLRKFVTSLELGLEKPEKLSYAAVTFGQGNTMSSPVVITSMQSVAAGCVNTRPVLSPGQHGDMASFPPTPLHRVFPTQVPGMGMPGHNYIVYSLTAPQSSHMPQGHVLTGDHTNYQHHSSHLQLQSHPRPPNHYVASFHPPNRSHPPSPQPGGYPTTQLPAGDHYRLNRGLPGHHKSPQTPAHHLPNKPRASPQYPPPRPSSAHQDGNVFLPVPPRPSSAHQEGKVFLPVPVLTSYPPPPFSPISQFSSPPPPVQKQHPPPPRTDCSCSSQGDLLSAQAGRIEKGFNKVWFDCMPV